MRHTFAGRTPLILLVLLAAVAGGCASSSYLSVRRVPHNPLAAPLQLVSRSGPQPSGRTVDLLRRYDLWETQKKTPAAALEQLREEMRGEPTLDKSYAFAELCYVLGKREQAQGGEMQALQRYSSAVAHAYLYLFSPRFDQQRSPYDPQFRLACDLYNAALEDVLRIINKQGRLRPGETYLLDRGGESVEVRVVTRGLWPPEAFEKFEFVSDYEVRGVANRHISYGLGVPLIAVRQNSAASDAASSFYPPGMSFPVTAVLRAAARVPGDPADRQSMTCELELHDPLSIGEVEVAGRRVPLETDLTTPLGYYLDNPEFREANLATWGLLNPNSTGQFRGLYMLEAFDPQKIPVLMIHGLWSSPETWAEMINELRSLPEIRNRYQFWTYLYPTGQPFWVSAAQLREDLQRVRQTVDAAGRCSALDQMVLVGHSMGGLVARMQTLESGDDFWNLLSNRPFDELNADPETRTRLASTVFFRPNPAVRRVITLGTPHRGSTFANDYTRWLGRKLITLPAAMIQTKTKLARDNPDFFQNTQLLTVNTSIDSLSPDSPVLAAMLSAERPPWVRYHNIVGVISEQRFLSRLAEKGDGVVAYHSASLDEAESEIVVDADHVHVHQHPRSILEVRRILLKHSAEMYAEATDHFALPATYQAPLPLPPLVDATFPFAEPAQADSAPLPWSEAADGFQPPPPLVPGSLEP